MAVAAAGTQLVLQQEAAAVLVSAAQEGQGPPLQPGLPVQTRVSLAAPGQYRTIYRSKVVEPVAA